LQRPAPPPRDAVETGAEILTPQNTTRQAAYLTSDGCTLKTLIATRSKILLSYTAWLILLCVICGVCYASLGGLIRAAEGQQIQEARDLVWRARVTIVSATTFAFVMTGLAWLAIRRDFRLRSEAEAALARGEALLRSFYDSDLVMMGVVETLTDDVVLISQKRGGGPLHGRHPRGNGRP